MGLTKLKIYIGHSIVEITVFLFACFYLPTSECVRDEQHFRDFVLLFFCS